MFGEIVLFLSKSIDAEQIFSETGQEPSEKELEHRLFFAANFLIVLRAQGRIGGDDDSNGAENLVLYNNVVQTYINFLGDSIATATSLASLSSVEMCSFYVAGGILGQD